MLETTQRNLTDQVAAALDAVAEQPAMHLVRLTFHRVSLSIANVGMITVLCIATGAMLAKLDLKASQELNSCIGTILVGYAVAVAQRDYALKFFKLLADARLNEVCTAYGTGLLICSLGMMAAQACVAIPSRLLHCEGLEPVLYGIGMLGQGICLLLCVRFSNRLWELGKTRRTCAE